MLGNLSHMLSESSLEFLFTPSAFCGFSRCFSSLAKKCRQENCRVSICLKKKQPFGKHTPLFWKQIYTSQFSSPRSLLAAGHFLVVFFSNVCSHTRVQKPQLKKLFCRMCHAVHKWAFRLGPISCCWFTAQVEVETAYIRSDLWQNRFGYFLQSMTGGLHSDSSLTPWLEMGISWVLTMLQAVSSDNLKFAQCIKSFGRSPKHWVHHGCFSAYICNCLHLHIG